MGAWNFIIGYEPRISQLENGWFCYHFLKEGDVPEILLRTWVNGLYFLPLFRLSVEFHPTDNAPKSQMLWVKLMGLPMQFWSLAVLQTIGNSIGVCRYADPKCNGIFDKRDAWILVEVPFVGGLPTEVDLEWEGKTICQRLDYWNIPFRCHLCHEMEHLMRTCSRWKENHIRNARGENPNRRVDRLNTRRSGTPPSGQPTTGKSHVPLNLLKVDDSGGVRNMSVPGHIDKIQMSHYLVIVLLWGEGGFPYRRLGIILFGLVSRALLAQDRKQCLLSRVWLVRVFGSLLQGRPVFLKMHLSLMIRNAQFLVGALGLWLGTLSNTAIPFPMLIF